MRRELWTAIDWSLIYAVVLCLAMAYQSGSKVCWSDCEAKVARPPELFGYGTTETLAISSPVYVLSDQTLVVNLHENSEVTISKLYSAGGSVLVRSNGPSAVPGYQVK